jgi:hypothetical protein
MPQKKKAVKKKSTAGLKMFCGDKDYAHYYKELEKAAV